MDKPAAWSEYFPNVSAEEWAAFGAHYSDLLEDVDDTDHQDAVHPVVEVTPGRRPSRVRRRAESHGSVECPRKSRVERSRALVPAF